jgi:hypothetical protein
MVRHHPSTQGGRSDVSSHPVSAASPTRRIMTLAWASVPECHPTGHGSYHGWSLVQGSSSEAAARPCPATGRDADGKRSTIRPLRSAPERSAAEAGRAANAVSGSAAARPRPATSWPSWPAASLSASFEPASFPCSSSCSCPWSRCLDLRVGAGAGETVSRGPGCPSPFGGSGIASCASRLCRTHRRDSIFVDFHHVASRVCAAREASEALRASRDDRVGVGAGLDHVTLFDLLVEKRVEAVPARSQGIDFTHQREYRKSSFSPTVA